MSHLVTGEAVVLELRLAKFPSRAIAFAIDLIVLAVVGVPLLIGLAWVLADTNPALQAALSLAVVAGLLVGVPVTVETLTRGKSLGKAAMGLRVVRDDGGPISFRHALTRGLAGFFVDFYVTSGAGAVICSLANRKGKRVGDILAGTVVIRESAPDPSGPMAQMPPELAEWASRLELSRLPSDLALAARHYLARIPQLAPNVRDGMGAQLATAVAAHVSPPAPPGTPAWAYLAAVLAERRRRDELRWMGAEPMSGWPRPPGTEVSGEPATAGRPATALPAHPAPPSEPDAHGPLGPRSDPHPDQSDGSAAEGTPRNVGGFAPPS